MWFLDLYPDSYFLPQALWMEVTYLVEGTPAPIWLYWAHMMLPHLLPCCEQIKLREVVMNSQGHSWALLNKAIEEEVTRILAIRARSRAFFFISREGQGKKLRDFPNTIATDSPIFFICKLSWSYLLIHVSWMSIRCSLWRCSWIPPQNYNWSRMGSPDCRQGLATGNTCCHSETETFLASQFLSLIQDASYDL